MIRAVPLNPADLARLAKVHSSAFDRPWNAGELQDLMEGAGTVALAVGERNAPDGFVMVRSAAGEAEILTLAVRPQARRRGLGLTLIEAALAAARAGGAEVLWLEVAADNTAALALYTRAGFEPAGRRPGYYRVAAGGRMDAIVMRHTLNTARS